MWFGSLDFRLEHKNGSMIMFILYLRWGILVERKNIVYYFLSIIFRKRYAMVDSIVVVVISDLKGQYKKRYVFLNIIYCYRRCHLATYCASIDSFKKHDGYCKRLFVLLRIWVASKPSSPLQWKVVGVSHLSNGQVSSGFFYS